MSAMKKAISDGIKNAIITIPEIKTVDFDRVRLSSDDFMSIECPAVQLIDWSERIEHERARAKKTWQLSLELVMKSTAEAPINQRDLWDTQYLIERAVWAVPNLGIPGVIHLIYQGSYTDLHLLDPFYYVRMDVEALYYEALVSNC